MVRRGRGGGGGGGGGCWGQPGPEGVSRPARHRRFPCPSRRAWRSLWGTKDGHRGYRRFHGLFPNSRSLAQFSSFFLSPSLLSQIPGTSVGRPQVQTHLVLSIGLGRLPGSACFPTPCRCHILKMPGWRCAGPVTRPRRGLPLCPEPLGPCCRSLPLLRCQRPGRKTWNAAPSTTSQCGNPGCCAERRHALVGGLWAGEPERAGEAGRGEVPASSLSGLGLAHPLPPPGSGGSGAELQTQEAGSPGQQAGWLGASRRWMA